MTSRKIGDHGLAGLGKMTRNIVVISTFAFAIAPTPSWASDDGIIWLSSVHPGDVVLVGTQTSSGCVFPSVTAQGTPSVTTGFLLVGFDLDPILCRQTVSIVCTNASECPMREATTVVQASALGQSTQPDLAPAPTCTGKRDVLARQWTEGFGPPHTLTDVRGYLVYSYNCDDGSAHVDDAQGVCAWAAWANWQNTACFAYSTGPTACPACGPGVAVETHGDFWCDNAFCADACGNCQHTMLSRAEGYQNGQAWCVFSWTANADKLPHHFNACVERDVKVDL